MKTLFWIGALAACGFALLLGFFFRLWLADSWPESLVFYGYRLTVSLLLSGGFLLALSAAFWASLVIARRRELAPTEA